MRELIYIFGANGQLGKSILNKLKNKYNVIGYKKKKLDIRSDKYNQLKIPKIIINCAAFTDVDRSEKNKKLANSINNLALINLSKFCKKNNILLIHFSTDFIFDGKKSNYYNENSNSNPVNYYGLSKLRGEKKISKYSKHYFIFRVSWLFSKYKNNFVHSVKNKLKKKIAFSVVNDLYGTPTSCEYVSSFIKNNIKNFIKFKGRQRIYHLTNGDKISKYEFAKKIELYLKKNNLITGDKYVYSKIYAKRAKNTALKSIFLSKNFSDIKNNWEKDLKKIL